METQRHSMWLFLISSPFSKSLSFTSAASQFPLSHTDLPFVSSNHMHSGHHTTPAQPAKCQPSNTEPRSVQIFVFSLLCYWCLHVSSLWNGYPTWGWLTKRKTDWSLPRSNRWAQWTCKWANQWTCKWMYMRSLTWLSITDHIKKDSIIILPPNPTFTAIPTIYCTLP